MRPIREKSRKPRGGRRWRACAATALVAPVLGLLASGCGAGSGTSASATSQKGGGGGGNGSQVSMAMFLVATANTAQAAALKGAEKAVEEDGHASLHVYNGNFDPSTQSNQIEDAIASGQYNAFLVSSVDGSQTIPSITKALQEKIVVVCSLDICGPDQEKTEFAKQLPVQAQIASDYFKVGEDAGNAVAKGCKEKGYAPCRVVFINGTPTLALDIVYKKGLEKALKEAPNIDLIAEAHGEFLAGPSYKAMKTIIQAHPEINAVVSVGDQMINGAQQAIQETPLKSKGVILVGDGASIIGTKGVKSGAWYASTILRPFHEGYVEAKYAMAAARGKPMSPDLVNTAEDPAYPEGYIDKANVGKWSPEWAG